MRQILWFRRDLRIKDNAILAHARGEVLPIFIFDTNILKKLPKNDKRVSFIYESVLRLKHKLQAIGLNLAVFYGDPKEIFQKLLRSYSFDKVLCSCDFDSYALKRDKEIETVLPMERYYDSFLIHPNEGLKSDGTPYKVFTPFYKNLSIIWQSDCIEEYSFSKNITMINYEFRSIPTLKELGFEEVELEEYLYKDPFTLLEEFIPKLETYKNDRDYFYKDATSKLSVHLRFGLISPKQIFNKIKPFENSEFFIRELFWREFYNYILFHFPYSETKNFNDKKIPWNNDEEKFKRWYKGETGIPIIDAAMKHLNQTGLMHNRLRMIVASFLTKNLFLPWQWGEYYFSLKLLDYEASSNIGSWQWGASTGADSVPYFRVFNPYSQSEKFDKEGIFIKSVLPDLKDTDPKLLHKENGATKSIIDIKSSREDAINIFKKISNV